MMRARRAAGGLPEGALTTADLATVGGGPHLTGMIRTYGLTHIALAVCDIDRSLAFYQRVLGVVPVYRDAGFVQAQTPGSRDVLVFEKSESRTRGSGGIAHFGFRLVDPGDIDAAVEAVIALGSACSVFACYPGALLLTRRSAVRTHG